MKPASTHSAHKFFFAFPFYFYDLAFHPSLTAAEGLARAIYKFQNDIGHKKASRIDPTLQDLVDRLSATDLGASLSSSLSRRVTRVARSASPRFYNSSWFINANAFPQTVARFEEIVARSRNMDSSIQQSITSAVTFVVATAVAVIQTKYESEMLSLRKMIEKSLLLRDSPLTTPPPDPNTSAKVSTPPDNPTKTAEKWNQADLGYFNPHFDKAHGEEEIVSVGKDVYYRNVILFVQRL